LRGRFISLEGGEGVGKSTQAHLLVAALADRGIDALLTREPGGSEGAEAIRGLLLSGADERWTIEAEALLFAAARADHVARTIRPALEAGRWVVCDRFLDSSRAYQGVGEALSDADILALHRIGSDGLLPDRTMLLTLPLGESSARADKRDGDEADRIGGRAAAFHRAVNEAFTRFAEAEPARFRQVDAAGSPEAVNARLMAALDDLLP